MNQPTEPTKPEPALAESAALIEWNKGKCLWQEDDALPPDAPTLEEELRKFSGFSYAAFKSEQLWDGGDYFIYRLISPDGKVYLQYLTYRGGGNELRHIAPSQPEASAEEEQTTPLLTGQWYHGNGVICCGTRRIARADFDTNPSWEFKNKVLGWLCETMNAIPSKLQALRDDPESDATDAAHPAWWRGEEYGAFEMVRMVEKILAGQDSGCGMKGNAKVEKARRDLISLVTALRDAEAKLAEAERVITRVCAIIAAPLKGLPEPEEEVANSDSYHKGIKAMKRLLASALKSEGGGTRG